MEEIFLEVEKREGTGRGKVKDLKDKGFLPAVLYSHGKDSVSLQVSNSVLIRLVHQHRIEGVIINLKIKDDKGSKSHPCLIKEIQYHPVHDNIIHVDFNEISLTKEIKVNIPITVKGEPVGVKQEGGSLEHMLWEVEIECLPTDIPKGIEIDIANLKLKESIHVKDLPVPPKVKILNDPSAIVLTVAEPMKEEVVVPVEGEVPQEPEVIKEKKEVPAEEGKAEEPKEKEKEKK